MADYDIDIEIDADASTITWQIGDRTYHYDVEELEGKGLIDRLLDKYGVQITVYSQGERYTVEEYNELFKEQI